jgi:hypothetical protein
MSAGNGRLVTVLAKTAYLSICAARARVAGCQIVAAQRWEYRRQPGAFAGNLSAVPFRRLPSARRSAALSIRSWKRAQNAAPERCSAGWTKSAHEHQN